MLDEVKTIQYTVYITDENNSVNGSGILFYPGGDNMFVFTCAHVVDELDSVRVYFLKPIDSARDMYDVFCEEIQQDQILYSPTDEIRREGGETIHSDDYAIIKLRIDIGKAVIEDKRFTACSKAAQKDLMLLLLYCYEIADLDAEFDLLEQDMRKRGFVKKYDVFRRLNRSFMKKEYSETVRVAEECINDVNSGKHLLVYAHAYRLLAKAYTENLPIHETIGKLLDEHENFIYEKDGFKDSALIYQMIGYVYGEKYHDYINAVRFTNRSYQIGFDNIVLETVGAAYYFLGISDATREDDTVDYRKLDKKSLYKAREYFLTIIKKADSLYWAGTVRRIGLCIYNTFVFLDDNYRILTLYPDIKKYIDQKDNRELWRDIEMKQARVLAHAGRINFDEYNYITDTDKMLLDTLIKTGNCSRWFEQGVVQLCLKQCKRTDLELFLKNTINETENIVEKLEPKDRLPIYIWLMNMYGRGMCLFGWEKKDKLNCCFNCMKDCGDSVLLESMYNFIFEFEAPLPEVIKRYRETFEKRKDISSWQELQHLYVRHGMMAEADAMYRELLTERKELIVDEPEYAYRAYIDYVLLYQRDLKDALQCYVDVKAAFKDTDIEGFWELELMFLTNTFNEPERFEVILKPFVEKGLLPEEKYYRMVFIANLLNLKEKKAGELFEIISQYPIFVNPFTGMSVSFNEDIFYLCWAGFIRPNFLAPPHSMKPMEAAEAVRCFQSENWHRNIDRPLQHRFGVEKKIVADAWSLFILEETKGLEYLHHFDCVYISHFTVMRLLEELSRVNSLVLRHIIDFVKTDPVCQIVSAGFPAQIEVRNNADYNETAAAVALALEKDCLVALGDTVLEDRLVDKYSQIIIRTNEIEKLFRK